MQVLDILQTMRIGSLSLEEMAEQHTSTENSDDPFAKASFGAKSSIPSMDDVRCKCRTVLAAKQS